MQTKKSYRFSGKEGSFIPEARLKKFIQRHQDHHEVRAHFFGKEILTNILNQPGCMGIRFYHAIDDKGQKTLVLVGTDEKGVNIWSSSKAGTGKLKTVRPLGGDASYPCPPFC
jgi:hypothetical protein